MAILAGALALWWFEIVSPFLLIPALVVLVFTAESLVHVRGRREEDARRSREVAIAQVRMLAQADRERARRSA